MGDTKRVNPDEGNVIINKEQMGRLRISNDPPLPPIVPSGLGSGSLDETIAQRAQTHGDFTHTGMCAQRLKNDMRGWVVNWDRMHPFQQEALDMIAQKIARILTGDPMEPDHWRDIAGYATMIERRLT